MGYWSLFYQLETTVSLGSISDNSEALFKGALFNLGIWERIRKDALNIACFTINFVSHGSDKNNKTNDIDNLINSNKSNNNDNTNDNNIHYSSPYILVI